LILQCPPFGVASDKCSHPPYEHEHNKRLVLIAFVADFLSELFEDVFANLLAGYSMLLFHIGQLL
jgi:hypothetical protein